MGRGWLSSLSQVLGQKLPSTQVTPVAKRLGISMRLNCLHVVIESGVRRGKAIEYRRCLWVSDGLNGKRHRRPVMHPGQMRRRILHRHRHAEFPVSFTADPGKYERFAARKRHAKPRLWAWALQPGRGGHPAEAQASPEGRWEGWCLVAVYRRQQLSRTAVAAGVEHWRGCGGCRRNDQCAVRSTHSPSCCTRQSPSVCGAM
jgi:hypothetical protein